jgi:hypothetical protein
MLYIVCTAETESNSNKNWKVKNLVFCDAVVESFFDPLLILNEYSKLLIYMSYFFKRKTHKL